MGKELDLSLNVRQQPHPNGWEHLWFVFFIFLDSHKNQGVVSLSVDVSPSGRLSLIAGNIKNPDVNMAISFPSSGCFNYAVDFGQGSWESINVSSVV